MTRERKLLAAVVGVALLARIASAVLLGSGFHFADETEYVDAARGLLDGQGYDPDFRRVPAYPGYLAILLALTPEPLIFLRAAHAALAALSCWLAFRLSERLFGFRPAAATAVLVAVDPLLVVSSALLYPEAVTGLVVLVAVTLALDAPREDRVIASATVGLLLGLAFQLRQVTLFFLPAMLAWTFVRAPTPRMRRGLLHAAVLVAAFLVALGPWALRNYRVHGTFSPIATAGVPGTPVAKAARSQKSVTSAWLDWAFHDTGRLARATTRQFLAFWELYPTRLATDDPGQRAKMHAHDSRLPTTQSFPSGLRDTVSMLASGGEFLLALVGIVFALRLRRAQSCFLIASILSFALGYSLFVSKMRYRIPILPLVFVFSGLGLSGIFALLTARLGSRRLTRE